IRRVIPRCFSGASVRCVKRQCTGAGDERRRSQDGAAAGGAPQTDHRDCAGTGGNSETGDGRSFGTREGDHSGGDCCAGAGEEAGAGKEGAGGILKPKLIALNLLLAAGVCATAWEARVRWQQGQAERQANLNVRIRPVSAPSVTAVPKPDAPPAVKYAEVAN